MNSNKYIKYKKKYLELKGGAITKIGNSIIHSCPEDCINISNIFDQIESINTRNNKKSEENRKPLYLIVPGNAGQPGGGHGYKLYTNGPHHDSLYIILAKKILEQLGISLEEINYIINQIKNNNYKDIINYYNFIDIVILHYYKNIESLKFDVKIENKYIHTINEEIYQIIYDNVTPFKLDDKKSPLEEQIMEKWLCLKGLHHQKLEYLKIATKWGLYKNRNDFLIATTIQGIDYTKDTLTCNPSIYDRSFEVKDISLSYKKEKEGTEELINIEKISLLFTFAPNFSTEIKYFTTEQGQDKCVFGRPILNEDDYKYRYQCIYNCIKSCFESICKTTTKANIFLPFLGRGVNKCFLAPQGANDNEIYLDIVKDVINHIYKLYPTLNFNIYVMLPSRSSSDVVVRRPSREPHIDELVPIIDSPVDELVSIPVRRPPREPYIDLPIDELEPDFFKERSLRTPPLNTFKRLPPTQTYEPCPPCPPCLQEGKPRELRPPPTTTDTSFLLHDIRRVRYD